MLTDSGCREYASIVLAAARATFEEEDPAATRLSAHSHDYGDVTVFRVPGRRVLHVVGDSAAVIECRRLLADAAADEWRLHPVADSHTPLVGVERDAKRITGSAREYNMLRRAGFATCEEIAATPDACLRELPGSGDTTLGRIHRFVAWWQKGQAAVATVLAAHTKSALHDCATELAAVGGVVVVAGFPASGKSTAAAYLAAVADATVLDKDGYAPDLENAVMHQLTGSPHDRDSDDYKTVVAPHIYSGLIRTGLTAGAKHPVVLDAPFLGLIQDAAAVGRSLGEHLVAVSGVGTGGAGDHCVAGCRRRGDRRSDACPACRPRPRQTCGVAHL